MHHVADYYFRETSASAPIVFTEQAVKKEVGLEMDFRKVNLIKMEIFLHNLYTESMFEGSCYYLQLLGQY